MWEKNAIAHAQPENNEVNMKYVWYQTLSLFQGKWINESDLYDLLIALCSDVIRNFRENILDFIKYYYFGLVTVLKAHDIMRIDWRICLCRI